MCHALSHYLKPYKILVGQRGILVIHHEPRSRFHSLPCLLCLGVRNYGKLQYRENPIQQGQWLLLAFRIIPSFLRLLRPENVGGGKHRLFISDNFRNSDPTLVQRISEIIDSAAIEIACRSYPEERPRKKAHIYVDRECSEEEVVLPRLESSQHTSAATSPNEEPRDPGTISDTRIFSRAASSACIPSIVDPIQLPLERNTIVSFVNLLKYVAHLPVLHFIQKSLVS
jgi:hypothetical protein